MKYALPLDERGFPSMPGGRIRRGWNLAKKSWSVLRADRSLMVFPLISLAATVLAAALLFGPGLALYYGSGRKSGFLIAAGILAAYALTFISVYFNVALAAAAQQSLAGKDTTLSDGLAVARSRIGIIARWALVQATVGLVLQAIQSVLEDNIFGRILAGLLSFAWSAATFFVVPVLALEGLKPREAFRRSVAVLRERWGEGVVGSAAIGLVVMLAAIIPVLVLVLGGASLTKTAEPAGIALLVLGGLVFAAAILVSSTLNAIFRVALYDFATAGRVEGPFAPEELANAFAPKRRRGLLRR